MPSTEPSGRPTLARRSTFQRMLDLERKNKMTMQSPTHPDPTQHARRRSTVQQPPTNYKSDRRPVTAPPKPQPNNPPMKTHAPKLSVAIPQPEVSKAEPTKKYVVKSGSVVSQEKADGGSESDRSSICRSPGWDDITGSKRKKEKQAAKEKRKAEKKRKLETDSETKHAEKMKNRLSKPPPTVNRLTKLASAMDRSPSSPTLQTGSGPLESKQDDQRPTGTRSRRGSIDIALKGLLNVKQGLPGLWKNSPTTATQTKPSQESPPSGNSNGFIGGLKLRLSEQAAAQNKTQDSLMTKGSKQQDSQDTGKDSVSNTSRKLSMRSGTKTPSLRHKLPLTSMYKELKRTSQDPGLSYSQAGRPTQEPRGSTQGPDLKLDHKNCSSTSAQLIQAQPHQDSRPSHEESSKVAKSTGPLTSHPNKMDHVSTDVGRPSSQSSLGKGSLSHRGRSPASMNSRTSSSHVQDQRSQSRDPAGTYGVDNSAGERLDSATRRSPSFHSVKSRVSTEIPTVASQPPTVDFNSTADRRFETRRPFSFFSEYTPPSLKLGQNSSASLPQQAGSRDRKSLDSQAPSSTRRQSIAAQPTGRNTNFGEIGPSAQSQSSRRPSTSGAMDGIVALASRAQGVLGGVIQSFTQDSSQPPSSSSGTPKAPSEHVFQHPSEPNGHLETSASSHKDGSGSHVRNATDSSEDYSTLDEFSNATTPMASRPQSQREYSPGVNGVKTRAINMQDAAGGSSTSLPKLRKKPRVTPGAIPYDESINHSRESWSRSAIPMGLMDDEDNHGTSTGNIPTSNPSEKRAATFTSSRNLQEPSKGGTGELQRQSSNSRSASTPDLQDLSFLPALRHQALTKPPDSKVNGIVSKKGKQPASSRQPKNEQIFRPPPLPLSGTKSAGGSPDSPTGGQYLRDARLNIPRAPGSPNRNRFPNSSTTQLASTKSQQGTEPIAKMLVVCCSCKYFHDMPSKIYECMAKPDNVVEDKALGVSGVISTSVKCPWCGHGMSTACCAGYAAVVYLSEKLH